MAEPDPFRSPLLLLPLRSHQNLRAPTLSTEEHLCTGSHSQPIHERQQNASFLGLLQSYNFWKRMKLNAKMEQQAHSSCFLSLKLGNFRYCPFIQLGKKMGPTQRPSASPLRLCSRNERQYLQLWRDRQTDHTSPWGKDSDFKTALTTPRSFPPVCSQSDLSPTAPSIREAPRGMTAPSVTPIPSPASPSHPGALHRALLHSAPLSAPALSVLPQLPPSFQSQPALFPHTQGTQIEITIITIKRE